MSDLAAPAGPGRSQPAIPHGLAKPAPGGAVGRPPDSPRDAQLRASAIRFEAAFLAEMLRHSGLGRMPGSFNGGAGEAAFSGTLIQEYAAEIARAGGIGLADSIFAALIDRSVE